RLPDLAVYPRCNPLRTSRRVGGYAVTSAPEGRGLHPHGNRVTRPHGLAACLEVLTSFQPTGHRSLFVEGRSCPRHGPIRTSSIGVQWPDLRPPIRSARPVRRHSDTESSAETERSSHSPAGWFC